MTFNARASLTEWMDEPCLYAEFRSCMQDLERVNRITLAYRPTLQWLDAIVFENSRIHIVDVGCGGGDLLRRVERWAEGKGIAVHLTGIDLNPHATRFAKERTDASSRIEWITGDAYSFRPAVPIDVVISSLFTHHLPDREIVRFMAWMEQVAARGWFVNDLHRERIPYYGFQLLARAMNWHRFVQHDGPISILRAFREEDWATYLVEAGIANRHATVQTFCPARLCISRVKR